MAMTGAPAHCSTVSRACCLLHLCWRPLCWVSSWLPSSLMGSWGDQACHLGNRDQDVWPCLARLGVCKDGRIAAPGGAVGCRNVHEELRGVLAVVRHGDRTPKQKMKMVVTQVQVLSTMVCHLSVPVSMLACQFCPETAHDLGRHVLQAALLRPTPFAELALQKHGLRIRPQVVTSHAHWPRDQHVTFRCEAQVCKRGAGAHAGSAASPHGQQGQAGQAQVPPRAAGPPRCHTRASGLHGAAALKGACPRTCPYWGQDASQHWLFRIVVPSKSCFICPIVHSPKGLPLTCKPLKSMTFAPACHAVQCQAVLTHPSEGLFAVL